MFISLLKFVISPRPSLFTKSYLTQEVLLLHNYNESYLELKSAFTELKTTLKSKGIKYVCKLGVEAEELSLEKKYKKNHNRIVKLDESFSNRRDLRHDKPNEYMKLNDEIKKLREDSYIILSHSYENISTYLNERLKKFKEMYSSEETTSKRYVKCKVRELIQIAKSHFEFLCRMRGELKTEMRRSIIYTEKRRSVAKPGEFRDVFTRGTSSTSSCCSYKSHRSERERMVYKYKEVKYEHVTRVIDELERNCLEQIKAFAKYIDCL